MSCRGQPFWVRLGAHNLLAHLPFFFCFICLFVLPVIWDFWSASEGWITVTCLNISNLFNLFQLKLRAKSISVSKLNWLQVEIVGQLNAQMAEMVGGVVETVGEEPEESEDFPEQHEEEEEELTKVSLKL